MLHTHMPYVEGFGTWPFGEEWLWEAMAGCYLPLLRPARRARAAGDALGDAGTGRSAERAGDRRSASKRSSTACAGNPRRGRGGAARGGEPGLARELERAWRATTSARLSASAARGGDLLGALARHARWTSSATHAVLPLLATDAGVRMQVRTGIAAHVARFGPSGWRGGFWLPECAHADHLEPVLAAAGVRSTCVELTDRFGLGAREHLRPLVCDSGVVMWPIDRETVSLVWSERGIPRTVCIGTTTGIRFTTTTRGETTARRMTTSWLSHARESTRQT